MENIEKILSAPMEDIRRGYTEEAEHYKCLFCGQVAEKDLIYPHGELFCDARRHMKDHVEEAHGTVFDYLLSLDKKFTGLSEHQSTLIKLFHQGKSDVEIQKSMGIAGSSTIRNHRFVLREKERQAKVFLILMDLMKANDKKGAEMIQPHKTARMVDDRYVITADEEQKLLEKYFPHGVDGPLATFAVKEKSKLVILRQIIQRFEMSRAYTEKEVNEILKNVYDDYVTLRRYLIEYGFMDRRPDGSRYWVKEEKDEMGDADMDRKKELQQQYKEIKKEAGVYQIRNTQNNRVLVVATMDLKTMNGKRFQLEMGSSKKRLLQRDWQEYGAGAFAFEVLEVLNEKEEGFFDKKDALKKLEAKWMEKLQPYGERGYHEGMEDH